MYNQASHVYQYCSGTVWKAFAKPGSSPGGGGCTNPAATEGKMIYSSAYKTLQFCDGTNWIAAGPTGSSLGGAGCAQGALVWAGDGGGMDFQGNLWGDGTYVYAANSGKKIKAYTFNGTVFTIKAQSLTATSIINALWGGTDTNGAGAYVYAAAGATGIHAYVYNTGANTWNAPITFNTAGNAKGVWSNSTTIFVADNTSGVEAFTFDGTTWTLVATYNTPGNALSVWGDGTYIYVADDTSGIRALTWNGTAWTSVATSTGAGSAQFITGDGTYIYVADGYNGLKVFTFNGTAFTLVGTYDRAPSWNVFVKNGVIFTTGGETDALTFNGTTFASMGYYTGVDGGLGSVWEDNNYMYVFDGFEGVLGYPKCN